SAWGVALGLLTLLCGLGTAAVVLLPARQPPWEMLRNISWDVLPLVAGLFVMVAALDRTGVVAALAQLLGQAGGAAGWVAGLGLGVLVNLVNNLPAGLHVNAWQFLQIGLVVMPLALFAAVVALYP
ncbi:SLC13 family permease, partial [Acidocella sp.]|uniref:SLC13 family permease n=1 Tax=Acidocella sp. TaxID=50710 RepID=UPI002615D2C0